MTSAHLQSAAALPAGTEAVERVYRDRYAEFLRVCVALTGSVEAGHDAVQEGFARGLRSLPPRLSSAAVEAWLWRVVTNAARDQRRRATVRGAGAARLRVEPPPAAALAEGSGIGAALAGLSERQRLIVFLRYYADLSYDQIAAALEIRPGTVAATLNAAHTALRSALAKEAP